MNTEPDKSMPDALRSEARLLTQMHGPIMARNFTLNPNAGTIRDIRDGSLWAFLDPDALGIREHIIVRFPIAKA